MMLYCCTADVVNRYIPPPEKEVQYPEIRQRLLSLMRDDQQERSSSRFFSTDQKIAEEITKREKDRTKEMLKLLAIIRTPSAQQIGLDGSRAVWLIALHNWNYNKAGETVLKKMQYLYRKNKRQVFYPGIPYLVDRIMVGSRSYDHSAKQLYGTQRWYVQHDDGTAGSGQFPILDPKRLTERRHKFDLASPEKAQACKHQTARSNS